MDILPASDIVASGLAADKRALEITMENVANQHATRGADGKPYKAKEVTFETTMQEMDGGSGRRLHGVQIAAITENGQPGLKTFDPDHPHADEDGWVENSNVSLSREMANSMKYSRNSEALLAMHKHSMKMTEMAIMMGRQ